MVVGGRLAQHGGQDPQDGVAMARMLPGACLRLRDGRDPTPTGGGAALGALLVISVSETPQTELEVAPGPRGSRSAGEGPAPVSSLSSCSGNNIQDERSQSWKGLLLRQLWH